MITIAGQIGDNGQGIREGLSNQLLNFRSLHCSCRPLYHERQGKAETTFRGRLKNRKILARVLRRLASFLGWPSKIPAGWGAFMSVSLHPTPYLFET